MTVANPYTPPDYGTRHVAVEKRLADENEKAAPAPLNKSAAKPKNKGA